MTELCLLLSKYITTLWIAPASPETSSFGKDGVMSSATNKRYPPELRERAVRMVAEGQHEYPSEWAAVESVADKLGIGTAQTLLNWIRKAQTDAGERPGVTSEMAAEMRKLRAEKRELKRANEILKSASVFVAAEQGRNNK